MTEILARVAAGDVEADTTQTLSDPAKERRIAMVIKVSICLPPRG